MKSMTERPQKHPDYRIGARHCFDLEGTPKLTHYGDGLCAILGIGEGDLTAEGYAEHVRPEDRSGHAAFMAALQSGDEHATADFAILRPDGRAVVVRAVGAAYRDASGTLCADVDLTDVTDLVSERDRFSMPGASTPCGYLCYTCEKQPKIRYINQTMRDILRIPVSESGEVDYLDLYASNVFLMIPMEERKRFALYLNRVYSSETPTAGEMSILRCDGTRGYVFGWVSKCINEKGEAEFRSVCMDVTERHRERLSAETRRYMQALMEVYDKIFEFNVGANSVKCLHSAPGSVFKQFENVPMHYEEATMNWIVNSVHPDDADAVRKFFFDAIRPGRDAYTGRPPQIAYRALSSDGHYKRYIGMFIKVDESTDLYCCRCVPDETEIEALRAENDQLKHVVSDFTDGLAAFEVTSGDYVKPLYASENVCEFFGYSKDEWLKLMKQYTKLERFVAYSEATYADFVRLIRNGEAEFAYFDYATERDRRIKAICSRRDAGGDSPFYVMLYAVEGAGSAKQAEPSEARAVTIRTFGYFDVFVGDKPVAFRNRKAKELFALLVDRRGGYITSEEAIGFLWEDETANPVTLSRYRKVALRLKNTLEEYGIADVMESVDGKRRIVPELVRCDLYDYLSGDEGARRSFGGSYLTNYSWAETTLAGLTGGEAR